MRGLVPPYLQRSLSKDKGRAGRKAETSLALRLGGTQTPGSGALSGAKGDVRVSDFLIENKSSTRSSFSVQQSTLHKIYQESLEVSRTPALSFQFVNSEGKSEKRDRWVCVPEAVFQELLKG